MSSARRRRPPSALFILCLALWGGVLFTLTTELIDGSMLSRIKERFPEWVTYYWVTLIGMGLGEALVIWFLFHGRFWARLVMLVITACAALAFAPGTPLPLYLVLKHFQMPFNGWPDMMVSLAGGIRLYTRSTETLWNVCYHGLQLGLMVATVVCLFVPHVVAYFVPTGHTDQPSRRPIRPLY